MSVDEARNRLRGAAVVFAKAAELEPPNEMPSRGEELERAAFELVACHLEATRFIGRVEAAAWVRSLASARARPSPDDTTRPSPGEGSAAMSGPAQLLVVGWCARCELPGAVVRPRDAATLTLCNGCGEELEHVFYRAFKTATTKLTAPKPPLLLSDEEARAAFLKARPLPHAEGCLCRVCCETRHAARQNAKEVR